MSDLPEASEASQTADQKVLELRGQGQAYARISRTMGLERAADAQKAFVRALGRLSGSDAAQARTDELARLDRLSERVRADSDQTDDERDKRLKTIEHMKAAVKQGG